MNFKEIYNIDVSANVSTKGRFKYLSWAHAWKWFVEQYTDATYEVIKDENNKCYFGDKETGYMVYTKVTVEKLTHEMWLPVMDHNNKAIKTPDMMAINKAVMRCLVKNLAMFGLGLNIYAGEDLPNAEDTPEGDKKTETTETHNLSEAQVKRLYAIAWSKGTNNKSVDASIKKSYNLDSPDKMNKKQYNEVCEYYEKLANKVE